MSSELGISLEHHWVWPKPLHPHQMKRNILSSCILATAAILPDLLHAIAGQEKAAHIGSLIVVFGERHQVAVNGIWSHDGERETPGSSDHLQGMRLCLPDPGLQGFADGTIPLQGDGYQIKGGDAHRGACNRNKNWVSQL